MHKVHVIGGGLAGCEAAWQCLRAGLSVILYEMRPIRMTAAHETDALAELVCSNSLKSELEDSAPGQLKWEMRQLDSLILKAAEVAKVPAGNALAVDRVLFSDSIKKFLAEYSTFELSRKEVCELPPPSGKDFYIVATGPLTSEGLVQEIRKISGASADQLYFYDAIAPIISADSIDLSQCFFSSRYEDDASEKSDYLNIPLNKDQYDEFVRDILSAEKMPLHSFETTSYFESCLPIEVLAERGVQTLRFGPMKPTGLTDPRTGRWPYAAIQLRKENVDATMYSMVGFQTKMKWPEQKRIFSKLPGLADVEFFRLGSVHRNTYFQSPEILSQDLSLRRADHIFLAGQITGVEGYTESAAIGLLAGRFASARILAKPASPPSPYTVLGSLHHYVTSGTLGKFAPMNANFGLLPKIDDAITAELMGGKKTKKVPKDIRKQAMCQRARSVFSNATI